MDRGRAIERLEQDAELDLLVIGGGINGAGIARDARLRGLEVALVEKGDWASGTSGRSSRLIHGGLRYLEQGRLGLVREGLRERSILLQTAPHLVRPLRILAPAWSDSPHGITTLSLGVGIYDLLAGKRRLGRRTRHAPAELLAIEPRLRRDRLQGAVGFSDGQCDDARLVLAVVRSAAVAGAACASYVSVEGLEREGGRVRVATLHDRVSDRRLTLRARAMVNATGAWAEETTSLAGARQALVRPTRGAHLVMPRLSEEAWILPTRDRRVLFVLPWGASSIVGTTDTDHRGSPDDVAATPGDVRFLIEELERHFPRLGVLRLPVHSAWAGLRPLAAAGERGAPGSVSRERRIVESVPGLWSVVGGKLTTFRALSEEVVGLVAASLGHGTARAATDLLPVDGADVESFGAFAVRAVEELVRRYRVPRAQAERLTRRYGTRVAGIAHLLEEQPELLARLCEHHPHLAVEAAYAVREEMALYLTDFLMRRTRIAQGACRGEDCAEAAAAAMARTSGWSNARIDEEIASFRENARLHLRPRGE